MGLHLSFRQPTSRRSDNVTRTSVDVEVWRVWLDPDVPVDPLAAGLSPEEMHRGARFHSPLDRDRYFQAHAALRTILCTATGADPAELKFGAEAHGKPRLANPSGALSFNLTHTNDCALIAVARDSPIGIDLEEGQTDADVWEVASQFFAPAERDIVRAAPPGNRTQAFLSIWTAKEAYLKGIGLGFARAPNQFQVVPAGAGRFSVEDPVGVPVRWWVRSLAPGLGFVGALAAPTAELRVVWRECP